jgi:hypothetical protein
LLMGQHVVRNFSFLTSQIKCLDIQIAFFLFFFNAILSGRCSL